MLRTIWRASFAPVAAIVLTFSATAQEPTQQAVRIGVILPETEGSSLQTAVVDAAIAGIEMAQEEFSFNAEMFGTEFEVITVRSDDAATAAEELLEDDVLAVVGGINSQQALALGEWSAGAEVPFINIAASSDALRNEACSPTSFHIAASAAMYLDAIAGWYVRAGFRRWHVVQAEDAESAAQYERLQWTLDERFFGAEEVGHTIVAPDGALNEDVIGQISQSRADMVLLLMGAEQQLAAIAALDAAGLDVQIAGYPYAETQTRQFFSELSATTSRLPANFRATAWEATLDAYGARELNARFLDRTGQPMDPSAWAVYQAIKVVYEAAFFSGSSDRQSVLAYLRDPSSVFDVWKGIGTSFRPWDRQLRQPLYLVEVNADATDPYRAGILVGELPAIYMPGTDPIERLDQLGDLADRSACQ